MKKEDEEFIKEYEKRLDKIKREYYPYTEQCPIDGKRCKKDNCEYNFYNNTKCYNHEIDKIVFEVFGTIDNYIPFADYDNDDIEWYLSLHSTYNNYEKGFMETGIEFRALSDRIYQIDMSVLKDIGIAKKFNLGDETIKFYKSSFRNLNKIKEYLIFFKDNKDKITEILNEKYRCKRCGKSTVYASIFNDDELICDSCQTEIIEEWIKGTKEIDLE